MEISMKNRNGIRREEFSKKRGHIVMTDDRGSQDADPKKIWMQMKR
jgi:hypothetical protein